MPTVRTQISCWWETRRTWQISGRFRRNRPRSWLINTGTVSFPTGCSLCCWFGLHHVPKTNPLLLSPIGSRTLRRAQRRARRWTRRSWRCWTWSWRGWSSALTNHPQTQPVVTGPQSSAKHSPTRRNVHVRPGGDSGNASLSSVLPVCHIPSIFYFLLLCQLFFFTLFSTIFLFSPFPNSGYETTLSPSSGHWR